jgi:hypothetical protein
VVDLEDFSYKVTFNSYGPFHIREIKPKDLYLAQILRNEDKNYLPLMLRLIQNKEMLGLVPSRIFRLMTIWVMENVMSDSIMTVENWMEVAFHLCKQRWDSSIDWLENQPMSKIKLMVDINRKFAQQQEEDMKKASKRKR